MYTIYPIHDLYLNVYERSSDHAPVCCLEKNGEERKERRNGTGYNTPLRGGGGGVNPSIRAAKKYSISSIAMAAQRDERFFFFFLVVYRYSLFFSFS